MPSPLRVPLPNAQELLGDRVDRGAMLHKQISSVPMSQRERLRNYNYWKLHNAELLETVFVASRYKAEYMSKVKYDHDFLFELEDRRNVELMLEQIVDEVNYLSSLNELLPVMALREAPLVQDETEAEPEGKPVIFIGYGRSAIWKDLRDFIRDRLQMSFEEFNRISPAGISVTDRLTEMLGRAEFAFLVLTGEDEQADGSLNARLNVVHEAGLFQGKLSFRRAIVLLEEGCEEFSNIHGLGQIRFPRGKIAASFEEIRKVLEREGLLPHALLGLGDDNRERVAEREGRKLTRREALYGKGKE